MDPTRRDDWNIDLQWLQRNKYIEKIGAMLVRSVTVQARDQFGTYTLNRLTSCPYCYGLYQTVQEHACDT
jgi:hypothetical protein